MGRFLLQYLLYEPLAKRRGAAHTLVKLVSLLLLILRSTVF